MDDLRERVERLEAQLARVLTSVGLEGADSGWRSVGSYAANWQAYGGGITWAPQYRRLANGLVILRGLVAKTVALAPAETIFMLPPGFRPYGKAATQEIFVTYSAAGVAEIRVDQAGVVQLAGGGATGWISLSGIAFVGEER